MKPEPPGLDPEAVAELSCRVLPQNWMRIIWKRYAANPLGVSPGNARFSDPAGSFCVL